MDFTPMRIKRAMELREMSQSDIVEKTGINKGALSSYLSGRYSPKQNNIYLLAQALKVNEAWLMGADVPMEDTPSISSPGAVRIPVYGYVAAGLPIVCDENKIDWEEIPEAMAHSGEYFGVQVKGNSMEPRILEGDVVIVRQQNDAESGDIVIAQVNGDEATCKRLKKYADYIELISNNPYYPPMKFTNEEIIRKPVKILGKVVELRGKF